jgi:hypothetical protein
MLRVAAASGCCCVVHFCAVMMRPLLCRAGGKPRTPIPQVRPLLKPLSTGDLLASCGKPFIIINY